jgi:2-methylisocitrate lyase-like PEP mutase family enzyme
MVAEAVLCGADPDRHLEKIREYVEAGFDHIYVHQVGPDQETFFRFYEREIIPRLDAVASNGRSKAAVRRQ